MLWRRTDKGNACRFAGFGKRRVLREKAIARVDRLRPGLFSCRQYFFYIEITGRCGCSSNADGLIGIQHMACAGIGL